MCARCSQLCQTKKKTKGIPDQAPKFGMNLINKSTNAQKNAPLHTALQITALHTPEFCLKGGYHSTRTRAGQANTGRLHQTRDSRPISSKNQQTPGARPGGLQPECQQNQGQGPATRTRSQQRIFLLLSSCLTLLSPFCSRRSSHFFLRSSVIRNIFIYIHDDFLAKRPRSDTLAGF